MNPELTEQQARLAVAGELGEKLDNAASAAASDMDRRQGEEQAYQNALRIAADALSAVGASATASALFDTLQADLKHLQAEAAKNRYIAAGRTTGLAAACMAVQEYHTTAVTEIRHLTTPPGATEPPEDYDL